MTRHDQATPEISPETVLKVARLARLHIEEGRIESLAGEMASILEYMNKLGELDLEGVEPMPRPGDLVNRLDDDVPGPILSTDQVLANASETRDGYIVVPKVIDAGVGERGESDRNDGGADA